MAVNGKLLIVEPAAGDAPEENFHPIGRLFYASSTALCVPHAHSEGGHYCLGAQAGPKQAENICHAAGYEHFSIFVRTPVNLIYQVY